LRYLAEGARRFLDKATEFDQLASAIEQAFAWTQEQPDTDRSGAH